MRQSLLKIAQARGQFIHSPAKKDIFGWWKTWFFLHWYGLKAFATFRDAVKFPHGQHPQIHHRHSLFPEKLSWCVQRQHPKAKTLNPKPLRSSFSTPHLTISSEERIFPALAPDFRWWHGRFVGTKCLRFLKTGTNKCTSPSLLAEVLCTPCGAKAFLSQLKKDCLDFLATIGLCLVDQVSMGYSNHSLSVYNALDTVLLSEQFSSLQRCFCL